MAMPPAKRLKENNDMDVTAESAMENGNGKESHGKGNIVSMLRSTAADSFCSGELPGQSSTQSENGVPNFKKFRKSHSKDSLSQVPVMHVTSYLDPDPRKTAPVVTTRRNAKKQKVDEEEVSAPVSHKRTEDDIDMTAQDGLTEESSSDPKDSSDATSPHARKRSRSRSVSV